MNRLTRRVGDKVIATEFLTDFIIYMDSVERKRFKKLIEKLASYEDAEEEGRLIMEVQNDQK